MELAECGITVNTIRDFARALITKSLLDIANNPGRYSAHTLCQVTAQLHALTTSSDGYPLWFDEQWLKRTLIKFGSILQKV
jgi:hypothetical protein